MLIATVQQALKNIIRQNPQSAPWAARAFQESTRKKQSEEMRRRDLIRQEAAIGAELFGEVPKGHARQFFCMDARTWVWHEGWQDPQTKRTIKQHVRYEVSEGRIIKSVNGGVSTQVSQEEAQNLVKAAVLYYEYVALNVYGKNVKTDSEQVEMPAS